MSPPAPPTKSGCSPRRISRLPAPAAARFSCAALFDKIQAVPQIAKRAEYKSAADMYMEKHHDRGRPRATHGGDEFGLRRAVTQMAADRHLDTAAVSAAFEASPQFAEDARARHLSTVSAMTTTPRPRRWSRAGAGARLTKIHRLYARISAHIRHGQYRRDRGGGRNRGRHGAGFPAAMPPASPATIFPRPSPRPRATRTSRPSCSGWIRPAVR